MAETFTALATRALASDFDLANLTAARNFAREAVRELYRETRLHRGDIAMALQNIGVGVSQLAIAGTGVYLEALVYADNGDTIDPMDYTEFLQLRGQMATQRGRPEVFTVSAGTPTTEQTTLELWPISDAAYQVFAAGASEPDSTFFDDADNVPLPDAWLKLVYYYVRAELFALEEDTDMFSFWQTRWINGSAQMRANLQRTVKANRRIPGTWSDVSPGGPTFRYKGQVFG